MPSVITLQRVLRYANGNFNLACTVASYTHDHYCCSWKILMTPRIKAAIAMARIMIAPIESTSWNVCQYICWDPLQWFGGSDCTTSAHWNTANGIAINHCVSRFLRVASKVVMPLQFSCCLLQATCNDILLYNVQ